MTQLAIDIPRVTVRVLKAQRTLTGDAVEADRIDHRRANGICYCPACLSRTQRVLALPRGGPAFPTPALENEDQSF